MNPQPIYTPENLRPPAYHLRFTWSGWPSGGPFPAPPGDPFWKDLDALWEKDGLRRLITNWSPTLIQFTFILHAARSETSSNSWKLSVMSVASLSA